MGQFMPVLIGKNLQTSVAPMNQDPVTAVYTIPGSPSALVGRLTQAVANILVEDENYLVMDIAGANWLPYGVDWNLELTELRRRGGATSGARTGINLLEEAFRGFSFAQVIMLTPIVRYTFIGEIAGMDWTTTRPRSDAPWRMKRVDLGFDVSGVPVPNPLIEALP